MADTQKLAGKEDWPFELYYWAYAVGVFLTGIVFALTLGCFGPAGMSAMTNLGQALGGPIMDSLLSGALFTLANILLVVAIDIAGMSLAFPVGVGLALVIGTARSYIQTPKGDPTLLSAGVIRIVGAGFDDPGGGRPHHVPLTIASKHRAGIYRARTRLSPASTRAISLGVTCPTWRVRWASSRVTICVTLATESFGRPVLLADRRTFPGMSTSRTFDVRITPRTVRSLLRLKASA